MEKTMTPKELTSDERELIDLNINLVIWEQRRNNNDRASLNQYLSSELVFRRADKTIVDKTEFMRTLDGDNRFTMREAQDVSVTITGDRALVTLIIIGHKTDGTKGIYRNIRVFFRRENRWRLE